MESLASEVVDLLRYLLPGFLSAWVFYGFTSFEKPSQFERVVQALIFTLIVQVFVYFYKSIAFYFGNYFDFGKWNQDAELVVSVLLATLVGFIFSALANNDKFHSLIRNLGISRETSYPSEWYGEFSKKVTYVVLHLDGERRLYGWPREWPSTPDKGHFSIQQASWLTDEGETVLENVDAVMVSVKDVKMIEFMKEVTNEQEII